MVKFGTKKVQIMAVGWHLSLGAVLTMLPAYCSNCSDAEQICDLATMISEDARQFVQRLGWQRIGLDLRLGGIALREGTASQSAGSSCVAVWIAPRPKWSPSTLFPSAAFNKQWLKMMPIGPTGLRRTTRSQHCGD